ncbi:hypothetical protein ACFWP4_39025, partial [Streptomyces sp. NPDC058486]
APTDIYICFVVGSVFFLYVTGVGLLGLRYRDPALGGRLRAPPATEGGFTVQAELPVERAS